MADAAYRLTLWGIEVFAAVADEGSVSAAARRLGASASAVSQQLSNLEEALGAALVDRSARPAALTPAGAMFRRRAEAILSEAAQARAELALADLSRLTEFRLGMIEDFDASVTPRLLSDMAEGLKGCHFLLETGPSHRLLEGLDIRALDIVVAADMGAAADWMEVHPLLEEPFVAAVPKGAALVDPQALPFVQYSTRHHMGRQIAAHLARQDLRLSRRFEIDSYHAIMAMVAEGAGWTILTPLGALHAQRFREATDILPLPVAPLSRTLSLSARRGVLGTMPAETAARLRVLLRDLVVAPAVARLPWLDGRLKVL
ncbi:MAG: LysR family transcriptional regulator [Rhodobacteraceae bacterium]|nr:LysR family transcriptional regulator [Paracoccaceae bacterium]